MSPSIRPRMTKLASDKLFLVMWPAGHKYLHAKDEKAAVNVAYEYMRAMTVVRAEPSEHPEPLPEYAEN